MTTTELSIAIDLMDPYDHERMRDFLLMLTETVIRLEKQVQELLEKQGGK